MPLRLGAIVLSLMSPLDRVERMISVEGGIDAVTADKLIDIAEKCPVHRTLEARSALATRVLSEGDSDSPCRH
jgi:hypothetical protein